MKTGHLARKILTSAITIIFFVGIIIFLNLGARGSRVINYMPDLAEDDNSFMIEEKSYGSTQIRPKVDLNLSNVYIYIERIDNKESGALRLTIENSDSELLVESIVTAKKLNINAWNYIGVNAKLTQEQEYEMKIYGYGSSYRLRMCDSSGFTKTPLDYSEMNKPVIALGIGNSEKLSETYGNVFYHSIALSIISLIILLLYVWIGKEKMLESIRVLKAFGEKVNGNNLFLALILFYLCMNIFVTAYIEGNYISPDSNLYLTEAVSIVNGYGFNYNGLAGYQDWFASWPILYPALIALVMVVTNTNAYLASKILTMLLIGVILLVFRLFYKKDAWMYSFVLLNTGFLTISYYTWSEQPFILFLILFTLMLSKIVKDNSPKKISYFLMGLFGIGCFLSRYFGIFVWCVSGVYMLYFIVQYLKDKNIVMGKKAMGIFITSLVSGLICVGYLLFNRQMSGMGSGVNRLVWVDDYVVLNNDFIESLFTEIANIFTVQSIPKMVSSLPYNYKALVLIVLICSLGFFVFKYGRKRIRASVFIVTAVFYYLMFTAVRFVSSMDTFGYRFWIPATMLLVLGLLDIIVPIVNKKEWIKYFAVLSFVVLTISSISWVERGISGAENMYSENILNQWEKDFSEIPEKSVIIMADFENNEEWIRPDVLRGYISYNFTEASTKEMYQGSDFLCIKRYAAEAVVESDVYTDDLKDWFKDGLAELTEEESWLILPIK